MFLRNGLSLLPWTSQVIISFMVLLLNESGRFPKVKLILNLPKDEPNHILIPVLCM
ncbi:hypothetical protein [Bacillus cereus group sp. BfR-BA-01445]|uniref:hypothetical protein n=1 Tax=Bacillus cereus group sp. BfR-BA-01445 TaxID=2920349 RepID=UPI001F56FEEC|nr:hypothetical protein [Bacillus cereus group sp. BfR-BA-01445]